MNFLDQFYNWMIESGRFKTVAGESVSDGSLGKGTARHYVEKVSRVMDHLDYLKKVARGKYSVKSGRDWRKVSVDEIKKWFNKKYPPGEHLSVREKSSRNLYAFAMRKFGQYMVHDANHWTEDKLFSLKRVLSFPNVEPAELVIEPPFKAHAFAEWLFERNKGLALPLLFGQWLGGTRFIESRKALKTLDKGSIIIHWKRQRATIVGKGREGKPRYPDFDELLEVKLKEYLEWRDEIDPYVKESDKEFLVVRKIKRGTEYRKLSKMTGNYNDMLTEYAEQYNKEMTEAGKEDLVLDLDLVSSHKLGRHVFGTEFAGRGVSEKWLKKQMGIETGKVVERYINFSDKQRKRIYSSVTSAYMNGDRTPGQGELADILSDIPPEKMDAVVELLKAMVS